MNATEHRPTAARLALVGDRSRLVQAHTRIPALIEAQSRLRRSRIEVYWLATTAIDGPESLDGFDGLWAVPGSPYRNEAGVVTAIEWARTNEVPFLGTCGGFQYMLIEFARHVCQLDVEHAELGPTAKDQLIVEMACSLLGEEETVVVDGGTLAASAMGAGPSTERFFCRYGLDPAYVESLTERGLVISGRDVTGDARVAELPGHPFFVGALFQPELASDPSWVHPLIAGFLGAVCARAAGPVLEVAN